MKGRGKIKKLIEVIKTLSKTKEYNWNITEVKKMKDIWTKKQENYLDDRFGNLEIRMDKLETRMDKLETRMDKLETRMDRLENLVLKNAEGIKEIKDMLIRNGMK